jgi:hypothetical protein
MGRDRDACSTSLSGGISAWSDRNIFMAERPITLEFEMSILHD